MLYISLRHYVLFFLGGGVVVFCCCFLFHKQKFYIFPFQVLKKEISMLKRLYQSTKKSLILLMSCVDHWENLRRFGYFPFALRIYCVCTNISGLVFELVLITEDHPRDNETVLSSFFHEHNKTVKCHFFVHWIFTLFLLLLFILFVCFSSGLLCYSFQVTFREERCTFLRSEIQISAKFKECQTT